MNRRTCHANKCTTCWNGHYCCSTSFWQLQRIYTLLAPVDTIETRIHQSNFEQRKNSLCLDSRRFFMFHLISILFVIRISKPYLMLSRFASPVIKLKYLQWTNSSNIYCWIHALHSHCHFFSILWCSFLILALPRPFSFFQRSLTWKKYIILKKINEWLKKWMKKKENLCLRNI